MKSGCNCQVSEHWSQETRCAGECLDARKKECIRDVVTPSSTLRREAVVQGQNAGDRSEMFRRNKCSTDSEHSRRRCEMPASCRYNSQTKKLVAVLSTESVPPLSAGSIKHLLNELRNRRKWRERLVMAVLRCATCLT